MLTGEELGLRMKSGVRPVRFASPSTVAPFLARRRSPRTRQRPSPSHSPSSSSSRTRSEDLGLLNSALKNPVPVNAHQREPNDRPVRHFRLASRCVLDLSACVPREVLAGATVDYRRWITPSAGRLMLLDFVGPASSHSYDLPPRAVPHPMLVPAPVEGREGRASSGTRATA